MKVKRRYLIWAAFILILAGVAIYQNCGGTQERTVDFSISSAQVNTYLSDVQCAASGGNTDAATTTAITNVSNIENQSNSEFFYSEAPSSMGDINIVAPLNYPSLRSDGGGTPQQMYAFFALGDDGTASLVIAVSDNPGGSSTPGPTPVGTAVATVLAHASVAKNAKVMFSQSHKLASSTSSPCSSSNPLNLTSAITAYNDGTSNLETASFDGDIFEMELALDGGTTLRIRSYDVTDSDLQSTIQLEINEVDPNTGQEVYLGDINLTQPD